MPTRDTLDSDEALLAQLRAVLDAEPFADYLRHLAPDASCGRPEDPTMRPTAVYLQQHGYPSARVYPDHLELDVPDRHETLVLRMGQYPRWVSAFEACFEQRFYDGWTYGLNTPELCLKILAQVRDDSWDERGSGDDHSDRTDEAYQEPAASSTAETATPPLAGTTLHRGERGEPQDDWVQQLLTALTTLSTENARLRRELAAAQQALASAQVDTTSSAHVPAAGAARAANRVPHLLREHAAMREIVEVVAQLPLDSCACWIDDDLASDHLPDCWVSHARAVLAGLDRVDAGGRDDESLPSGSEDGN